MIPQELYSHCVGNGTASCQAWRLDRSKRYAPVTAESSMKHASWQHLTPSPSAYVELSEMAMERERERDREREIVY